LAAESWSAKELLAAGWTPADLAWEETTERAVAAFAEADAAAKEHAGKALRIARENFAAIDPRLGTALANYGVCLGAVGEREGVPLLLREAGEIWRGSGPWIARMDAPRIARSSLFHMRMEARHRATYRARWQVRWQEIAGEAKARLRALDADDGVPPEVATDALARWRRERPAMLNDTRKLIAAAFLLLAPQADGHAS